MKSFVPCVGIVRTNEELNKMSTVQLIRLMRTLDFSLDYECYECHNLKECRALKKETVWQIYEILKTRPHIPRKNEARKLRQARAKNKFKTFSAR